MTTTGHETAPAVRVDAPTERLQLDADSWIDITRGWLAGADDLYALLRDTAQWNQERLFRYERWIDEPRLSGLWRPHPDRPHPVMADLHRTIQQRYRVTFDTCALAWYRDGRDSVAWHRDRELRHLDDTIIGVLTLGARRPFLLRSRAARYDHDAPRGGATVDLAPASGDLLVMGGACQDRWEHAVPKVPAGCGGRISLQWRWTSRRGRPVVGASYRAPRTYSHRR